MKTKPLACIAFIFVVGISRSIAAGQSADVTESHKTVVYGSSQSTHTLPAPTGTSIRDGQYLKTGADSYAELTLPSTSITRLGANTIFNFSVAANEVDLQAGTILFCKPKDAKQ